MSTFTAELADRLRDRRAELDGERSRINAALAVLEPAIRHALLAGPLTTAELRTATGIAHGTLATTLSLMKAAGALRLRNGRWSAK